MAHAWFYADSHNQQQGPVDASLLRARADRGELPPSTLVWREGLSGWVPLSQVAAELGVTLAAQPPSLPQAGRVTLVSPKGGGGGAWVVVIVIAFVLFAVLGILAAIAIPAYSDYTARARIAAAYNQALALKPQVFEAWNETKRCPVNGDDGFRSPHEYADASIARIEVGEGDDGRCTIAVEFKDLGASRTAGAEIVLSMDAEGNWASSSTMPPRYLPASLRNAQQQ